MTDQEQSNAGAENANQAPAAVEAAKERKTRQRSQSNAGAENANQAPAAVEADGDRVFVAAGDLIVYMPNRGGDEKGSGGWFKAPSADFVCTHEANVLAIAKEDFHYHPQVGERYHSIEFEVVRRFFKDPARSQIVNQAALDRFFEKSYLNVTA